MDEVNEIKEKVIESIKKSDDEPQWLYILFVILILITPGGLIIWPPVHYSLISVYYPEKN